MNGSLRQVSATKRENLDIKPVVSAYADDHQVTAGSQEMGQVVENQR